MNEEYEYRYENTVSTKIAIVELQGDWRAVYYNGDGSLEAEQGSYFMAVIRTKAFRRRTGSSLTSSWEPCPLPSYMPRRDWGVVMLMDDTQTLEPLSDCGNFVRMLPPGQEISDSERATFMARHRAAEAHKTAPTDLPS